MQWHFVDGVSCRVARRHVEEGHSGDDVVRGAGEGGEDSAGVFAVGGFAEDAVSECHDGVTGEDAHRRKARIPRTLTPAPLPRRERGKRDDSTRERGNSGALARQRGNRDTLTRGRGKRSKVRTADPTVVRGRRDALGKGRRVRAQGEPTESEPIESKRVANEPIRDAAGFEVAEGFGALGRGELRADPFGFVPGRGDDCHVESVFLHQGASSGAGGGEDQRGGGGALAVLPRVTCTVDAWRRGIVLWRGFRHSGQR